MRMWRGPERSAHPKAVLRVALSQIQRHHYSVLFTTEQNRTSRILILTTAPPRQPCCTSLHSSRPWPRGCRTRASTQPSHMQRYHLPPYHHPPLIHLPYRVLKSRGLEENATARCSPFLTCLLALCRMDGCSVDTIRPGSLKLRCVRSCLWQTLQNFVIRIELGCQPLFLTCLLTCAVVCLGCFAVIAWTFSHIC